jgi:hypothetical protein
MNIDELCKRYYKVGKTGDNIIDKYDKMIEKRIADKGA